MYGAPPPPPPFPTLYLSADPAWEWPQFPFAWGSAALQADALMQACRIETIDRLVVEGTLAEMDLANSLLACMSKVSGQLVSLPFARVRRLTMTHPMEPTVRSIGAPEERIPAPSEERDYELTSTDPKLPPLTGRTQGHLERDEGLYLFEPVDEPRALLRVFVPRAAYAKCVFGRSIKETAGAFWIHTPEDLLAAIEQQEQTAVLPIGHSLTALGLISQAQLKRLLAEQPADIALGDMLVAKGLITLSDLWTALAHKMRYPLLDLSRFPIDLPAAMWSTVRLSLKSGALPIMVDGQRLIVAVDRPANAVTLRNLSAASGRKVVPVFARQFQILGALERLSRTDVWAELIPTSMDFTQPAG